MSTTIEIPDLLRVTLEATFESVRDLAGAIPCADLDKLAKLYVVSYLDAEADLLVLNHARHCPWEDHKIHDLDEAGDYVNREIR